LIRADVPNRDAVFRALCKDGAPLKVLTAKEFRDAETGLQIGVPPNRIDILQKIDGISFDQASKNHIDALMEGDTPAYVISREDLIRNRLAWGPPRDLLDVEQIPKAALYAPSAAQGQGKRPRKKRRPNRSGH
jgi:hypothetical protein